MVIMTTQELTEEDRTVCQDAEKFSKLFYEAFDKRRQVVSKMYKDTACVVWNGEALTGQEEIAKFLATLPTSEHELLSIDAHRVNPDNTNGKITMMVLTSGTVTYEGRRRSFTQTFVLTTEGDLWRIASDRLRFVD